MGIDGSSQGVGAALRASFDHLADYANANPLYRSDVTRVDQPLGYSCAWRLQKTFEGPVHG
jgi:hypothetical protein